MGILGRFFIIVFLFLAVATVLKFTHDYIYTQGYNKYEDQIILAVRSGRAVNLGKVTVATGAAGEGLIFIEENKNGN